MRIEKCDKLLPVSKTVMICNPREADMNDITQLSDSRLDTGDDLEIDLKTEIDDTMACSVETIKCV